MSSTSDRHTRHPTWPLTFHLLPDSMATSMISHQPGSRPKGIEYMLPLPIPEINENDDPFSHFLSPVLSDEEEFVDDKTGYNAGIAPESSPPSAAKSARFRARLEEKWEGFVAKRMLSSNNHHQSPSKSNKSDHRLSSILKAEEREQEAERQRQRDMVAAPWTPPREDQIPDLDDDNSELATTPDADLTMLDVPQYYFPSTFDDSDAHESSPTMGRATQTYDTWIATPPIKIPARRPRFKSARTLSGKKHSWREPSLGLWTVDEELEDEDVTGEYGVSVEKRGRKKRRKSVSWAEEVLVLEFER